MNKISNKLTGFVLLCALANCAGIRKESCSGLNPFLPTLSRRGVVLFQSASLGVAAEANKCSYEWKLHGTCCDFPSLTRYAALDRQQVQAKSKKISGGLGNVRDQFREFKKIMETASKIDAIMKNNHLSGLVSLIKFFNSPESNDIAFWVEAFGHFQASEGAGQRCVDAISTIRTGALCAVCSGRSKQWFSASKALLGLSQCHYILDPCLETIRFLAKYLERASALVGKTFAAGFETLNLGVEDRKLTEKITSFKALFSKLSEASDMDKIRKYYHNPSDPIATADLCESLVTILRTSFLGSSSDLLELFSRYLKSVNQILLHLGSTHLAKASNWRQPRRVLAPLSLSGPFGFPGGDVKAVQDRPFSLPQQSRSHAPVDIVTDSRFTKEAGPMPINCSIRFP
jgi:hypothetical protein